MKDILIGIDAGTSVIKSVAFDLQGRQIAVAAIPNRYDIVAGGGAEQDQERTWADTAQTLRQLADKVPDLARRTAAVAVTAQGDGTWLIDKAGEPVAPGWLWLDARAADIVDTLRAGPADEARYAQTGSGLNACQMGSQMMWMQRHAPAMLERAATGFHCKDWLYFCLTGIRATDPSEACFTFGDFRTRTYSDEVIAILGLEKHRHLLPEIVDGTRRTHALTREGAAATGLTEGTPIVLGYVDVACTALGGGLYDKAGNAGCSIVGSTGMHMRLARGPDDVHLSPDKTGYTMCMPVDGVYAQMQSNMAATLNIDWILDLGAGLLAQEGVTLSRADMIGRVDRWIAASAAEPVIYQPYISEAGERGPFIDASARAGFIGLNSKHGYGDMVRAVFEGLAFAARDCYGAMGPLPAEVRLSGGAGRSETLRRILSACLGARVRTSRREEAGAAGAAMIAAVAVGVYPDMDACAAEWVLPLLNPAEEPDPALAARYARTFPVFQQAHRALSPVWRQMAQQRGQ